MGLIADYLEEYRERSNDDPCLYIPGNKVSSVRKNMISYQKEQNLATKEKLGKQLADQYCILDSIRHKSILHEKIIRRIINQCNIESAITLNILNALLKLSDNTRASANTLIHEISSTILLYNLSNCAIETNDEKSVIIGCVLFSIYRFMTSDIPMDSSEFRCLVYDSATLISIINPQDSAISKKNVFIKYISETYGLIPADSQCTNCDHRIYHGFHNCLNCFERI